MKLPRHSEIWLPPYMADRTRRLLGRGSSPIRHVWLTVADHFEPFWNRADFETARRRVEAWRTRWPEIAASVRDDTDAPPRYTFFYPVEQYHPELLESLAKLTRDKIADVEVHIHHDGEGREDFISRITGFNEWLTERHGLLRKVNGHTRFGFIHGNWALDNALPDGRWCGLNDEITLLRNLGCYADFTMPSGACPSQARMLNTVYWCADDPHSPKSYDSGVPVREGKGLIGDLLMIPGPLGLRWRERRWPRMETGELAAYDPPTAYRARRWFDLAPRISENAFLKLYTHGATDSNLKILLDTALRNLFDLVRNEAKRRGAKVHFVSAWQIYLAIEAIGQGRNPERAVDDDADASNHATEKQSQQNDFTHGASLAFTKPVV
jgi:hypothetical protein